MGSSSFQLQASLVQEYKAAGSVRQRQGGEAASFIFHHSPLDPVLLAVLWDLSHSHAALILT